MVHEHFLVARDFLALQLDTVLKVCILLLQYTRFIVKAVV